MMMECNRSEGDMDYWKSRVIIVRDLKWMHELMDSIDITFLFRMRNALITAMVDGNDNLLEDLQGIAQDYTNMLVPLRPNAEQFG